MNSDPILSTPTSGIQTGENSQPSKKAAADLRSAAQERGAQLKQAASEKVNELRDTASAKIQTIKEAATEKAGDFKNIANEKFQEGKVQAREIQDSAEDYIRAHPTKSVLTAVGVGFLIGLIVRK